MVTCNNFNVQIILYFLDCSIAPLWFKQNVTKLFKRMTTAELILSTNMKISKILNMSFM